MKYLNNDNIEYLSCISKNPFVILSNNIIRELKDISLELTDIGFDVKVMTDQISTVCVIRHNKDFILTEVITEVIERVKDYISSEGLKTEVSWINDIVDHDQQYDYWRHYKEDRELIIGSKYSDIWIRFKNKNN